MKIKKGDTVQITTGKDRGKSGKVLAINPQTGRLAIEGLNLGKRHKRPKKQGEKGEIVTFPRPMDISNVMMLCPRCGKAARVGFAIDATGKKSRVCKRCGGIL